jgi:hypothetical protein
MSIVTVCILCCISKPAFANMQMDELVGLGPLADEQILPCPFGHFKICVLNDAQNSRQFSENILSEH